MNEAEAADRVRLRLVQSIRILLGFLMCLPFFAGAYIGHAVNMTYFQDTYDPVRYWMTGAPVILTPVVAGGLVAFWRFRSARAGGFALTWGIAGLLLVVTVFWWRNIG